MGLIVDKRRLYFSCFMVLCLWVGLPGLATAQRILDSVPELQRINIEEHLGTRIPLDLTFTDQTGRRVTLRDYFKDGRPVLLNMAYYDCPMLCTVVLNGVAAAVKPLEWMPGKEFQMVVVSINPRESHDLASAKRTGYLNELNRPGAEAGWAFLVGDSTQSRALANALGFEYFYDEENKQYAHPAATFIMTPDGTISRYLYGIEYKPTDVRMALLEASDGRIGTTIDRLILYCYHYDPEANSYVLFAENVMRLGGLVTVSLLALFVALLGRKERRDRKGSRPRAINAHLTENRR